MNCRIVPRLEIKGPNLVKGIQFEGLRVIGNPRDFAREYYRAGADELIYIDIVASLYDRRILPEVVRDTAREIFIPLTVGGGIRTLQDIEALLNSGADKVAINTAAVKNPKLLRDASERFGSQCIVLAVEAKRVGGVLEVFTENGRERTGKMVDEWVKEGLDHGVGEVLLTSVDNEGTHVGFDHDLIEKISGDIPVPLLVAGGAGCISHVEDVVKRHQPDAVCCSSLFHYHYLEQVLAANGEGADRVEFLRAQANYSMSSARKDFAPCGIDELKRALESDGVGVRL